MANKHYARMNAEVETTLDNLEAEREGITVDLDCSEYPVTAQTDSRMVFGMKEERPDDSFLQHFINAVLLSR